MFVGTVQVQYTGISFLDKEKTNVIYSEVLPMEVNGINL